MFDLTENTKIEVANGKCHSPRFSPSGKYVGFIKSNRLTILEFPSKQILCQRPGIENWCWGKDDEAILYVRQNVGICKYSVNARMERPLVRASPLVRKRIVQPSFDHPVCFLLSPNGDELGLGTHDGSFYTIDVESGRFEKRLRNAELFTDLGWSATGICYHELTKASGNEEGRLWFLDLAGAKPTLVAKGSSFHSPQWLNANEIVVCKDHSDIWSYDVRTAKARCLFSFGQPGERDSSLARVNR